MPQNVPNWWTDDRVDATVNRPYVLSQLRTDEQELLNKSPLFGDGLTDDTYLDWILTKARRFFLTLVEAGVPDQIFGIVDDSWDDEDLPIAEESVADLRLSYERNIALNKRFYKAQYRFLLRVLEDGEHIRYADEEIVPVYATGLKATILSFGNDGVDKVRLSASTSRFFVRKKIGIGHRPKGISELQVLGEIASLRQYAHPHILGVFASYLQQDSIYVLFTPAPAYSLKSFVSDVPKVFDNLPKPRRRQTLLSWPHCLASALRWLHVNGRHHGAIRPSNIQVDDDFHIYLGQFDDSGVLGTRTKIDDIEAYQYAAPERWKRAVTMQKTAPSKVMGASGGRTARRIKVEKAGSTRSSRSSWSSERRRVDIMNPTSTTYSFMPTSRGRNFSRLQLSKSSDTSFIHDGVSTTIRTRANTMDRDSGSGRALSSNRSQMTSALSNASSGSNKTIKPAFTAAPEVKTAVVTTWASAQHDLLAADVFSMGAVIMDIMTLICKKSAGSFARHRSSKNRQAGRGGGLADASFHANIGQVVVWATQLQSYAADRAKKGDGVVFKALGPIIQLIKDCLEREPEERLRSDELECGLGEYISEFSGIEYLHCIPESSPKQAVSSRNRSATRSTAEQSLAPTMEEDEANMSGALPSSSSRRDEWSKLRSRGLTTTTIPSPGPDSSLSSLSSFNFEYDAQSDTLVGEDKSVLSNSSRATEQQGGPPMNPQELNQRLHATSRTSPGWNNWHRNDSSVDPTLTHTPDSAAFQYANYSASETSEEGHGESFLLPPSRPSSMQTVAMQSPPPTRALPAIPKSSKHSDQERESSANHRPRTSSLPPGPVAPLKTLNDEDFQALNLKNSAVPSKRRRMLGKGSSFLKNL